MERISSRRNPLLVELRKLRASKSLRRERGLFLCEGPKLLEEALRSGAQLRVVVRAGELPWALPAGVREIEVPEDVLESVADTAAPQGPVFLCALPELKLPEKLEGERYLVLDGVQDPGNVGTIWRTADALGVDGLILIHSCADPFSPKTVRATMGACFRLPVWEGELAQTKELLDRTGLRLYATALREDARDIRTVSLSRSAVLIGSEGKGVSPEALALCGGTLKIPMRERCESLNAAVAAAVTAWEMGR